MRYRSRSVAACRGRPLAYTKPMALQTRVGRVDLQLEGGEFGGFLLLAIELLQAGLEASGEEEGHRIRQAIAATRCSEALEGHGAFHQR